ncbi:chorismate synthase [Grosmannia clavigera kw1407]|uniref:chorismate synthase n=1 Tax=Grosmannia clavigera (strain kw1407 / UAMH 11150) TaxID=655863 RepID=F0XKL9_GROCL|nr:chorismate synthase [Grosmannia clavigera kw1407]EFX01694.1 chorismate synthase [Grosmannia clavigera kw1407]
MSTFGQFLRVTTYGESHCPSVGCIVDNFPPGVPVSEAVLQPQISRRRPGQSSITTPRNEADLVSIQSGVEGGVTLGTPIAMVVKNQDFRPSDYKGNTMKQYPRPSHADFTYLEKYGVRASSGGGRSSARETIGRVAAGALCEHYLKLAHGIEIVAWVSSVGSIYHIPPTTEYPHTSHNPEFLQLLQEVTRETVDKTTVRCPDPEVAAKMEQCITDFRDRQDSIGGTVTCVIRNLPTGLGEPVFSKLEATLAHGMLSIPATKGFEIGSGFEGTEIPGSAHNDMFIRNPDTGSDSKHGFAKPKLTTSTNNSGGIQGGISNGANVFFRVAFKPPATIGLPQETVTFEGESDGVLEAKGRHDPCVVPRAVPIVEAMASICIMDALLMQGGRRMAAMTSP